jgi:hypothetical protein
LVRRSCYEIPAKAASGSDSTAGAIETNDLDDVEAFALDLQLIDAISKSRSTNHAARTVRRDFSERQRCALAPQVVARDAPTDTPKAIGKDLAAML